LRISMVCLSMFACLAAAAKLGIVLLLAGLAASVIGAISSLSILGGDSLNGVLSLTNLGGVGSLTDARLTTLVGGCVGGVSGTEIYDDKRSPDCLPMIMSFSSGQCPDLHFVGLFTHFTPSFF